MEKNEKDLLQYVGDIRQVCGIKEYELTSGKARGMRALDVKNGSGIELTVLPDRCLDIGNLSFMGVNCSFLSKTGFVAPGYYNESVKGFMRGFFGGFMTTCGLRNVGNACQDGGESFEMHGRVSHIPAEEVCATTDWEGGRPVMTVSGKVRESTFFGENVLLERKIRCVYGENRIRIENRVENQGFKPEIIMTLFHFNLGYPLLNEEAVLLLPGNAVEPRDAEAAKGIHAWHQMQPPTHAYAEQVFYHDLKTDEEGNTCVALVNPRLELAIVFRFSKKQFFNLAQWKQMGESEYVLGIEPGNCYVGGRLDPRNQKVIPTVEPGGSLNFDVEVDFVVGQSNISELESLFTTKYTKK